MADAGFSLDITAWAFEECGRYKCDDCEYMGCHAEDYTPLAVFVWNCAIAVALAAAAQKARQPAYQPGEAP